MRAPHRSRLAPRLTIAPLAVGLALVPFATAPAAAEPMRQLVIQTASEPADHGLEARRFRLAAEAQSLGLRVIGSLVDGLPPALGTSTVSRTPFDLDPERVFLLEATDSLAAEAAARRLADDPGIDWVEFNRPRVIAALPARGVGAAIGLGADFPNDPYFPRQWGLRNVGPTGFYGGIAGADVHALEAWGWSVGANDLRLAVADTGIDPGHPELQATMPGGGMRIELGMNVTSDPSPSYADSFGHGTPVAGVMAARTGEGAHFDSLGVAGVCGGDGIGNFGCRIVPIKIAPGHSGNATSYDISRAILYATSVGARAMNLSFAGSAPSRLERNALYHAITHGCVVVAASGNMGGSDDPQPHQYPAAYAAEGFCIQVGASDYFDTRCTFSSYGPGLDVVAPGLNIWTTFQTYRTYAGALRNGYVAGSGTSFAAPHVTGIVGLLAAARPELGDTDFQNLVRQSADDIDEPGVDVHTGWGRVNAGRALASVRPTFGIWHDEVPAQFFHPQHVDSLEVGESGPGNFGRVRQWPEAKLIEATATVTLPDSFLDSVRVWPRVGGTTTIRGNFRIPYFAPWSRVSAQEERSFTLSGFIYHLEECLDCPLPEDAYMPLPPDEARFGFTVIGRVDRPPSLSLEAATALGDSVRLSWRASDPDQVTAIEVWLEGGDAAPHRLARVSGAESAVQVELPCPAAFRGPGRLRLVALDERGAHHDRTELVAPLVLPARNCGRPVRQPIVLETSPNPFRGTTRIAAPAGSRLTIVDVSGRVVRRARLDDGSSELLWDGKDDHGRRVAPGIYLVRCAGCTGRERAKVLKLE